MTTAQIERRLDARALGDLFGGHVMKASAITAAFAAVSMTFVGEAAIAADVTLPTKAPALATPTTPATCTNVPDFFVTDCILSWYGIQLYGTVDIGGDYQSHGARFNGFYGQGSSYSIQKMNRQAMWGLAPSGLGQSDIGIKGAEPIGHDWQFIFQLEAGFDPYSMQLANGAHSIFQNLGVPLNQQSASSDSSRSGQFYNSVGFVGVSSPTYGTLTFFRQNSLTLDAFAAYDPMALSYAFSQIGFSSVGTGAGISETARATTSAKYRYQIGDFRFGALWQFGGYDQNNGANGAVQFQFGGDIRNFGPGTLSLDAIYSYEKDARSEERR